MKTLIVIHSQSGHTAKLARAIAQSLRDNGHDADIELLRPKGRLRPGVKDVQFMKVPEIGSYDTILFGGPVWGFGVSPVTRAFLALQHTLAGKRVLNFVTKGLPFQFTGGYQALKALDREARRAGAQVLQGVSNLRLRANAGIEQDAKTIVHRLLNAQAQNPFDTL